MKSFNLTQIRCLLFVLFVLVAAIPAKKSGGKKKKKTSSKSSKNKNEGDGVQQLSGEIGGNSSANSEQDVSVASDTDKDVSSIASEVEEQIAAPAQQVNSAGLKYHY